MLNHAAKVVFCLTMAASPIAVLAQSKTPEERVKSFYSWYLKSISDGADPSKNKTMMNSHTSARLSKWFYSKAGQDMDADYFVQSQDWSEEWADSIVVGEPSIKGVTAVLNITLGSTNSDSDTPLIISLIKEGGVWKIDRVAVGAATVQAAAKRPALPDNLATFVGQYPAKLMKVPSVSRRLKALLSKSYPDFADSISVQHEITKDGDFLLASGCMQHMCDSNGAVFVIDLKNKRIHAAIFDAEAIPQFFNEDKV